MSILPPQRLQTVEFRTLTDEIIDSLVPLGRRLTGKHFGYFEDVYAILRDPAALRRLPRSLE